MYVYIAVRFGISVTGYREFYIELCEQILFRRIFATYRNFMYTQKASKVQEIAKEECTEESKCSKTST